MKPGRLVGHGREAEIFDSGDGKVLRLLRDPSATIAAQRFSAGLRAASASGAPVPKPFEDVVVDGRPGLIMEAVDGPSMLTRLGRTPWIVFTAGRTLGRVHARIHEVLAPAELPAARADLRERIERGRDVLDAHLAEQAIRILEGLPDGDRLCHGDYHPGNLLEGRRGAAVIDWTLASRGHPDGDVARALMALTLGEPPPGSNAMIRVGAGFARGFLVNGYVRAYRTNRPFERSVVDRWMVVQCAARFAERIEGEYAALTRVIDSHIRRATT